MPDPEADQGPHRFTYALLPHSGDWRGEVLCAGYGLNNPARLIPRMSPISVWDCDQPALILETLKPAEDGQGLILRCYEAWGTRGTARLRLPWPVQQAQRMDLLEQPVSEVEMRDEALEIPYKPFEIITLRISTLH